MESPRTVTLTIRAPNHEQEDEHVTCQLDWSIEQLKDHLQQTYPGRPAASSQKLIYAGHMLRDHVRLREVIVGEDRHVVHLVLACDPSAPLNTLQPGADSCATLGASSSPDLLTGSLNYWVNWIQWYTTWDKYGATLEQWQEMYNAHAHVHSPRLESSPPPPAPVLPPAAEAAEARQGNEEGGGGFLFDEEDEEGAARDWLDWLYLGSRLLVLLAVVYFYSTLGRFLFVVTICFAFYLYQRGVFTLQRRQGAPQQLSASMWPWLAWLP